MSQLSCRVEIGGIREFLGMGFVSDGNGMGMGMGMKSLKWEGNGTKNLFPHTSSSQHVQLN